MKLYKIFSFGFMLLSVQMNFATSLPRLLIKIATRSHPELLFKTLDLFYQNLSKKLPYTFVINCDIDDQTMNNEVTLKKFNKYPHLYCYFDNNTSKVSAYNADIKKHNDFDILIIASDNIDVVVKNFDIGIAQNMLANFPDYDGVLNFYEKRNVSKLNIFPIIGKKFYDAFGYVFNPCYQSSWCKKELTDTSRLFKKEKCIHGVIFKKSDANNSDTTRSQSDEMLYTERRKNNFDINPEDLEHTIPKMWSILICTLENREKSFNHIYTKLQKQIADLGLEDQIEILYFKDNRENSVGFKRNWLLEQSCGKYTCYVDDDDDISDDYIKTIYEKLLKSPDCVSLQGIITFGGRDPRLFIHSIRYNTYFEKDNIYYRPPNHLNPIKRMYGCLFLFPEINRGEDTNWAMQIVQAELLKYEEEVDNPYYFYLYDPVKTIDKQGNS